MINKEKHNFQNNITIFLKTIASFFQVLFVTSQEVNGLKSIFFTKRSQEPCTHTAWPTDLNGHMGYKSAT